MGAGTDSNVDAASQIVGNAAGVAKWLVPSAAVLFGVTGYVVQFGQESLLGIEAPATAGNSYAASAAEFLRESVVRLFSYPFGGFYRLLLGHPGLLLLAIGAASLAIWGPRSASLRKRTSPSQANLLAAIVLVAVIAAKFLILDAPLLKIENLVSRNDVGCWSLVASPGAQPGQVCPELAAARGVNKLVWANAREIAAKMVCSRVTAGSAAQLSAMIAADSSACRNGLNASKRALADEFLCNLAMSVLTIVGAIVLLRSPHLGSATIAMAVLVILYGVTTPYAYGKIGRTQLFDFSTVRVSKQLAEGYVAEDPGLVSEDGAMQGAILHRDASGATILVMRTGDCPPSANGAATQPERRASLSVVPNSQLLSLDEIAKVDLITWLAEQQRRCPNL